MVDIKNDKEFIKHFKKHLTFFIGRITKKRIKYNIKMVSCPMHCSDCSHLMEHLDNCEKIKCPVGGLIWQKCGRYYKDNFNKKLSIQMLKEVDKWKD